MASKRLLIFDLDGVVTTEHIYWGCARLTIWELMQVQHAIMQGYVPAVHLPLAREQVIPLDLIYTIKNRAINSNWDLTFFVACGLLLSLPEGTGTGTDSLEEWWQQIAGCRLNTGWREPVETLVAQTNSLSGAMLLEEAGRRVAEHHDISPMWLRPEGPFWQMLFDRFQGWYSGRLMGLWGALRLPEHPVVPVADMHRVFSQLVDQAYTLGIVTGRPREEALYALHSFDVAGYFDSFHLVMIDDVLAAQRMTGRNGLGKPHPFPVRKAIAPQASVQSLVDGTVSLDTDALMIGDSTSDALAAAAAGIGCVGVTSGVEGRQAKTERRAALLEAGCVAVLDDIRDLPAWLAR